MRLLFTCALLLVLAELLLSAGRENKHDYLERIRTESDWKLISGKPLSDKYGNVSSVKIVYDIAEKKIYFIHSRRYRYHFDFCSKFLNTYESLEAFNQVEYSAGSGRKFLLANLNYFVQQQKYVLEFFADDKISAGQVVMLYNRVKERVFFSDRFFVVLNSGNMQEHKKYICAKAPCIEVDSLYAGQRYQCLVQGEATGKLRFVEYDQLASANLRPQDVVVTNGLPLVVPPVAAIITAEFQTPLSHVNMLAQARGLPDAALRGIWNDTAWRAQENQWVKLHVETDSAWIEPASETVTRQKKKKETKLDADVLTTRISSVRDLRLRHIDKYGGKAGNMGELFRCRSTGMNLPENAFAIPFYYYAQHVYLSGAQQMIDSLLADSTVSENRDVLEAALKKIRRKIKQYPVSKILIDSVAARMRKTPEFAYFRFRSSTNAEDIEGFNGAGLYDSYSGSLNDTLKTIENAIRKVWASTWNLRAFEERGVYNINQRTVVMAILVHRAFGTEKANGVAITANIYRYGYPSFVINCQHGEVSVVSPDPGIQCEQIVLNHKVFSTTVDEVSMDYISHSSLFDGAAVLTEAQLLELAKQLFAIKEHFYYRTRYGRKAKGFLSFAMDVEFKVDAPTGKIYIKQARPFEMRNL